MNGRHVDASMSAHSLDDDYYFGGEKESKAIAIHPHRPASSDELELEVSK